MALQSEPTGSVPKPLYLRQAFLGFEGGRLDGQSLSTSIERAVRETISDFETAGATVVTDGEQGRGTVPYVLQGVHNVRPAGAALTYAGDRTRRVPRLVEGPFRYGAFASAEVVRARPLTTRSLKTRVVSPASLLALYPPTRVPGYGRDQFLEDLSAEAARDIASCFQFGADIVRVPFVLDDDGAGITTRWRASEFVEIMGEVLRRLSDAERRRLGVSIAVGTRVLNGPPVESALSQALPELLELDVGSFCVPMRRVADRSVALATVRRWLRPPRMCLLGVIDPGQHLVEDPVEIAERIVEAAGYVSLEYLGTTDDDGFGDSDRGHALDRQRMFAKVAAREAGTRLAAARLGL